MKLIRGLNRSVDPVDQPEGSWRKAMNMMIERQGSISNERGFTQIDWESNRITIGTINLDTGVILFTVMYDPQADPALDLVPKIYLVRDISKYVIFEGDKLDLSPNRPITGTFFRDTENILNLIYTDGEHIRLLKVNNEESINVLPDDLNLFPTLPAPEGKLTGVVPGGSLQAGAYQFLFALELEDGTVTHFMNPTNWVYVHDKPMTFDNEEIDGVEGGSPAGKAIELEITGLNPKFKNLHVGVIKKINQQVSAVTLSPVPIKTGSVNFYYGGQNELPVEVEKLIAPYQSYSKAKALTIYGDRLYLGNLNIDTVLKYQKYANNIVINFTKGAPVSLKAAQGSYKEAVVSFDRKSFMPGEVYAFYIRFMMKDGTYSPCFHIPGRARLSGDANNLSAVTNYAEIDPEPKKFQFVDTSLDHTSILGTMAYHENIDEQYPDSDEYDGSVDYEGNPIVGGRNLLTEDGGVKHHRFPTLNVMQSLFASYRLITSAASVGASEKAASSLLELPVSYGISGTANPADNQTGDIGERRMRGAGSNSELTIATYGGKRQAPKSLTIAGQNRFLDTTNGFTLANQNDFQNVFVSGHSEIFNDKVKASFRYEIDCSTLNGGQGGLMPHPDSEFRIVQQTSSGSNPLEVTTIYHNNSWMPNPENPNKFYIDVEVNEVISHLRVNPIYVIFRYAFSDNLNINTKIIPPQGTVLRGTVGIELEKAYDEVESVGDIIGRPLQAVASNIYIPDELASKIQGFEILAAERGVSNATILGQSVVFPNDTFTKIIPTDTIGRFHSFDMLKNKPNEKPTHLSIECIMEPLAGTSTHITDTLADVADLSATNYVAAVPSNNVTNNLIRKISGLKYLPPDNIAVEAAGLVDGNRYREEAIALEIPEGLADFADPARHLFLCDLRIHRKNVYSSFMSQRTMKVSRLVRVNSGGTYSSGLMYGDTFISPYGVKLTTPGSTQKEYVYNFACFSVSNIGLRHEGSEWHEKYYPKSIKNGKYLYTFIPEGTVDSSGNDVGPSGVEADRIRYAKHYSSYIGYNKDYSSVNNLFPSVIFNPNKLYADKFPYRVARSMFLSKEAIGNPYRLFQVLDYYEMPKNKGVITNLASFGPLLLIHHEYSLFRTVGKEKIVTDAAEVYLGTGDPFERPPEEMIPVGGGYAGTKAQQSCIVTKAGYFFVDNTQGRVFLVNDTIEEISARGLRGWFRSFGVENSDNPHISTGYLAGYDQLFNRIILRLHGECGFTVSYSPDIQAWVSFHSYKPRFFASYQNHLYSGDGSLAKHNNPHWRCVYYVQVPEECYIDIAFPGQGRSVLDSLVWHSECWNRGIVNRTETFSHATVYNSYQISGKIPLSYYNASGGGNYRSYSNQFIFNGFRDMATPNGQVYDAGDPNLSLVDPSKPWHQRARFVDNYHIVRLYYDNPFGTYMNVLYLYSIQPVTRQRI